MNGPPHLLPRRRPWILAVLLVLLLAGHGVILYYASSRVNLSAAVLSGAIILLVLKHVGLLGPVYALLRRLRSRKPQAR
jgi:drug/metabolite transporter (DMT)-like permease